MSFAGYLLTANAAVWIGLAGYLFFLARKQAWLTERIEHLEALDHEHLDHAA